MKDGERQREAAILNKGALLLGFRETVKTPLQRAISMRAKRSTKCEENSNVLSCGCQRLGLDPSPAHFGLDWAFILEHRSSLDLNLGPFYTWNGLKIISICVLFIVSIDRV